MHGSAALRAWGSIERGATDPNRYAPIRNEEQTAPGSPMFLYAMFSDRGWYLMRDAFAATAAYDTRLPPSSPKAANPRVWAVDAKSTLGLPRQATRGRTADGSRSLAGHWYTQRSGRTTVRLAPEFQELLREDRHTSWVSLPAIMRAIVRSSRALDCEASLLRQVDQILPDCGRPEKVRRLAKMAGEPTKRAHGHLFAIGTALHCAGASSRD